MRKCSNVEREDEERKATERAFDAYTQGCVEVLFGTRCRKWDVSRKRQRRKMTFSLELSFTASMKGRLEEFRLLMAVNQLRSPASIADAN